MMNRIHSTLLAWFAACWLTAFSVPAPANDFQLGMMALDENNGALAIRLWRPLAELGDADAQFGLGVIYNDAMGGIPQDYAEANYWFLRAAEQGYAPAQYNLGNAYKNGTGMHQDDAMAVIWWRKAAEQGFGPAQFNLATALLEGSGVPRDKAAAIEWYRRAADNGHPTARANLEELTGTAAATPGAVTPPPAPAAPASVATPTPAAPSPRPQPAPPAQRPAAAAQVGADDIDPQPCLDWLAQADAAAYTIQLMASREPGSARHYLRDYPLEPAPVVCPYPAKGGTWYAIVTGRYANADAARQALAAMPDAVRKAGPYLRRLDDLRKRVDAAP